MHPYPLRKPPEHHLRGTTCIATMATALHRRDRAAHVAGDLFGMAAIAADFDNDGNTDLLVTGYGTPILYRNKGDGTLRGRDEQRRASRSRAGPSAPPGSTTTATAAWMCSSAAT